MRGTPLYIFIARCVWLVFALVMWIVALNRLTSAGNDSAYIEGCLFCLIPMLLPVARFFIRRIRGAAAIGSQYWDVTITDYGRLNFTNRAWYYGFIAALIWGIVIFAGGIIILPFYWFYILYTTVMIPIRLRQGGGE